MRERLTKLVNKTPFEELPEDQSLSDMLEQGELDAWLAPAMPECFLRGSPNVRRLFPDYRRLEEQEARRTRNMPLLHNLLIRREIHERDPGIAQALIAAFERARNIGKTRLNNDGAFAVGLPWIRHDLEEASSIFGRDWYEPSFNSNREMMLTMARYAAEQGFTATRIEPADYFIAESGE
jgi:4,5-dihydroxyphthalate decarboxylase